MCDAWMPLINLPLTIEQFRQLPRNTAYKYEYFDDEAHLSPRPRHYHALLELRSMTEIELMTLSSIQPDDVLELEQLFALAFRHIQPYGCLTDASRLEAARQALQKTRTGGDGPWIERASFVARSEREIIGAIWITLLPDADPSDWDSYQWEEPPPADCIERRLGRPHLTWVFVLPSQAGRGVGTTLLAASVGELLTMGYKQLASTFLAGNDSSMLWHWRNGFRLLPHPGSHRLMKQRSKVGNSAGGQT